MCRLMPLFMLLPDFSGIMLYVHGKSVRIYGEASLPDLNDTLDWTDIYKLYKSGQKVEFTNYSTIEPVKNILSQTYPSVGDLIFPDVMRADLLIKELA